MNVRGSLALAALASLLCPVAGAATVTPYPAKPIRLIVPQQAGSSNDTLSRVMANFLGDALGQQVVVDNRAGVGGIIGMEIGASAVPDGHTLISMATAQVIAPHLQRKLAYDTFRDFSPLSWMLRAPLGRKPSTLITSESESWREETWRLVMSSEAPLRSVRAKFSSYSSKPPLLR